jgi:hypothetical protein
LAAHLAKFDGTLVRRGTPVEKHCSRVSQNTIMFLSQFEKKPRPYQFQEQKNVFVATLPFFRNYF